MKILQHIACLGIVSLFSVSSPAVDPVRFYGIGDVPYFLPGDEAKLRTLYRALKEDGGQFVMHVGDITDGISPLTDAALIRVRGLFEESPIPLVYTPADNCWGDAHRPSMGGYDPLERLAFLRQHFYRNDRYFFGAGMLDVNSQAKTEGSHREFVENIRFQVGPVLFVGLHLHNGYTLYSGKDSLKELERRNAALRVWLDDAFRIAEEQSAMALVLFSQSGVILNRGNSPSVARPGFEDIHDTVVRYALKTRKPILWVIGGGHSFNVDKPLVLPVRSFQPSNGFEEVPAYRAVYGFAAVENLTQVMVPGAENVQAIRVTYDAAGGMSPFQIEEMFIPANRNVYETR